MNENSVSLLIRMHLPEKRKRLRFLLDAWYSDNIHMRNLLGWLKLGWLKIPWNSDARWFQLLLKVSNVIAQCNLSYVKVIEASLR